MQIESPNWFWSQLGFTIVRDGKYHRKIFDNHGRLVCQNAGYDLELGISRWLFENLVDANGSKY